MLDLEKLEQIKRIAIIAFFSHDDLMDSLVLKHYNPGLDFFQSCEK